MDRYMPATETYARRHRDLVGSVGQAMFSITDRFGLALVDDDRGLRHQVPCRTEEDAPVIAKGERVLLINYDANVGLYRVIPYELGATDDRSTSSGRPTPRDRASRATETKG
jgi:hypothetical protein